MDPHVNPATGVWDDNYYANVGSKLAGGGGGGSSAPSVDSILNSAIDAYRAMVPPPPKPYDQVNPFSFDEALATQASKAEYTPYYQEQLTDYVSNIEKTKSRSQEDLAKTLDFLSASKDYFVGKERRALDTAERNANEGYAGRGLFFSGVRQRDIKEMQTESQAGVADYMKGYNYKTDVAKTDVARQNQDLATQQQQYTRDIGRQQDYAVAQGVQQRKQETLDQYELGRKKYYEDWYYNNYPA